MKAQIIRILERVPTVKRVVSMHSRFTEEEKKTIDAQSILSCDFEEIFKTYAHKERVEAKERSDDHIFSILYTSGSTGK